MVDRETNDLSMRVKVHYDTMHRVSIRTQHYYFTDIAGTPFSLGIALVNGYGQNAVNGLLTLDKADLSTFSSTKIKVASWNYCKMETNETRQDAAEMLRKYLDYGKSGDPIYEQRCDNELIESILYDAEATRTVLSSWFKENRDGTLNDSASKNNCTQDTCKLEESEAARNGVEVVFLGTKGGLTRYHYITENLTDPDFIHNHTNTIEEIYYIQAVEGGDKIFTFSVPFDAAEKYPDVVVTASMPIVVRDGQESAVAMAVGMQMRYDKFAEFFMNTTMRCPRKDIKCNLTCNSSEIDCYLLDSNGYVVFSENPTEELGIFFGSKDRNLMNHLIRNEEEPQFSRGVFKRVQMFDYQGVCQIWVKDSSSARSIFITPFAQLSSILWWFFFFFSWFAVQFNVFSIWPNSLWVASEIEYQFKELDADILAKHEISEKNLTMCDIEKKVVFVPGMDANLNFTIYKELYCPYFNCSSSYSIHRVPHTNLMLLAVDAGCACDAELVPVEPTEVKYNDTMMCQRLQTEIYRKRPSACYSTHKSEDSKDCGRGSFNRPSVVVVITAIVFTLIGYH